MKEPPDCTVLGLDPGTNVTGVALVRFAADGTPSLLFADAFDAAALESVMLKGRRAEHLGPMATDARRIWRIRETRRWLSGALSRFQSDAWDAAAYETPNANRGPVGAINQAIGAYLTLSWFAGVPLLPINATTAKACTIGGDLFRAKGTTAADRDEKGRMVAWAYRTFGVDFDNRRKDRAAEDSEAIADACAVAYGAYRAMQKPATMKRPRRTAKKAIQQP